MIRRLRMLVLASFVLVLSACGAKVTVDTTSGGTGGESSTGSGGSGGESSTGSGVVVPCAVGQCVVPPAATCMAPSGPTGNGCCECGNDGVCSSLCK